MDGWTDEFIPAELQNNILTLDKIDHYEREGYTVSLESGNYENDLQAAQDINSFDSRHNDPLITGSVSTDINGARQNPDLRQMDGLLDTHLTD
jgi:hypothetical protein